MTNFSVFLRCLTNTCIMKCRYGQYLPFVSPYSKKKVFLIECQVSKLEGSRFRVYFNWKTAAYCSSSTNSYILSKKIRTIYGFILIIILIHDTTDEDSVQKQKVLSSLICQCSFMNSQYIQSHIHKQASQVTHTPVISLYYEF